jgi:hypothetical protein
MDISSGLHLLLTSNKDDSQPEEQSPCSKWARCKGKPKFALKNGDKVLAFDIGQIHLAECMMEVDLTKRPPFTILHWEMNNLGTSKTTEAVHALCSLAQHKEWSGVDYLVIEQQDKVNIVMMMMSRAVQAVVTMLNLNVKTVISSSAAKFNVFKKMKGMTIIKEEPKTMSAYKRKQIRKLNAIKLTSFMLQEMPDGQLYSLLLQETAADQRDDLSDAFVYASGFIYKNEHPLPKKR